MTIWFTSDQHFGHRNICELSGRPFDSLEHMERAIIERFNQVVGPHDMVIHAGDFSFYPNAKSAEILRSIRGYHILVMGNHDRSITAARTIGFMDAVYWYEIEQGGRRLFVRHVPDDHTRGHDPRKFEPKFHHPAPADALKICGHVHEKWRDNGGWVNVGVDQWNFGPVRIDHLLSRRADG